MTDQPQGPPWPQDPQQPPPMQPFAPPEIRAANLNAQVQHAVMRGWRVEVVTADQAVVVEGKPVNHVLHLLLTLVTCLTWGPVWIVLAILGGEKRHVILVDAFGNVTQRRA